MKPSTQPPTAIQDARRMLDQRFSPANITRTLVQKYHLKPAEVDAILQTITPSQPAPTVDAPCPNA